MTAPTPAATPPSFEDLLAQEQAAHEAVARAQARYREVLSDLRGRCPHDDLLQIGWEEGLTAAGALPIRICRTCGVEEESQTFRILTGPVEYVDRRTVYATRKLGERARVGGSRLFRG